MPAPAREITVAAAGSGTVPPLPAETIRYAVAAVLDAEGAGPAVVSVTFLSSQRMRALNRRTFGRDRSTDVIAFGMPHDGRLVADLYVCPAAARQAAEREGVPPREELLRLLVHGVLHALGYDHPAGDGRTRSAMWTRQERLVRALRA